MGWERRINKAKRDHRTDFSLKDWYKDELYKEFSNFTNSLEDNTSFDSPKAQSNPCNGRTNGIDIHHASELSVDDFITKYEAMYKPVMIQNVPQEENWDALKEWPKYLQSAKDLDYKLLKRKLKCGEDDDGRTIRVKLKYFLKYMKENKDDSPLYIFDSRFDDDRHAKVLLKQYRVPSYFPQDLFSLVGERRRPPYRWFLLGPERSGTTVHTDPLGTSAWNTLISGRKRWVLFPPHTPKHIAKCKMFRNKGEDDEAVQYFMTMLPRMKRHAALNKHLPAWKDFECIEFTQEPGDTVYVPGGWHHAVLNLTHTVGITQNYCSERNFDAVWLETRSGRKRMAWKWLCKLKEDYPHLAKRAIELNAKDQFVMKYDPHKNVNHHHNTDDHRMNKRSKKETSCCDNKYQEQLRGSYQFSGVGSSTSSTGSNISKRNRNYQVTP